MKIVRRSWKFMRKTCRKSVRRKLRKFARKRVLPALLGLTDFLIFTFHRFIRRVIILEGVTLRLDRRLSPTIFNALRKGRYERNGRELVLPELDEHDVVMELGGGMGYLTIHCAKKVGSDRVSTFEANPRLERVMRENFRLNGVSPKAEFCALGKNEGLAAFHLSRNFWGSSMVRGKHHSDTITIPVKPFNGKIRELKPTFLIVDIEGAEYELFQYADLGTVKKMMVEVHTHVLGAEKEGILLKRINDLGFALKKKNDDCSLFCREIPR